MKTRYLRLVKKQRGFTLIELLAVILILGIIALIAIPTVSSVVEQSRRGSAENSAKQFITSINEYVIESDLSGSKIKDGIYGVLELISKLDNIKGVLPSEGYVTIKNGEVNNCSLVVNDYVLFCNEDKFDLGKVNEIRLVNDANKNGKIDTSDEVTIGTELFYVMSSDDSTTHLMSKGFLNVGFNYYDSDTGNEWIKGTSFKGTSMEFGLLTMDGYLTEKISDDNSLYNMQLLEGGFETKKINGEQYVSYKNVIAFAPFSGKTINNIPEGYWSSNKVLKEKYSDYDTIPYVYDENSYLYEYISNYYEILKKYSNDIITVRLPKYEELAELGCDYKSDSCSSKYVCDDYDVSEGIYYRNKNGTNTKCKSVGQIINRGGTAPNWVYDFPYYTGSAMSYGEVYYVSTTSFGATTIYAIVSSFNLRVTVEVPTNKIIK